MAETRWLSETQQAAWRSYLAATRVVSEHVNGQLHRESAMPHAYYEILVRLSEAPQHSLRMSALAERSLSSKSRVSHAVTRLEAAGWVRREDCETDRRGQVARLTDAGMAALRRAAPCHVAQVREVLIDALSDEQLDQLHAICDAVLRHAGEEPAADVPLTESTGVRAQWVSAGEGGDPACAAD